MTYCLERRNERRLERRRLPGTPPESRPQLQWSCTIKPISPFFQKRAPDCCVNLNLNTGAKNRAEAALNAPHLSLNAPMLAKILTGCKAG